MFLGRTNPVVIGVAILFSLASGAVQETDRSKICIAHGGAGAYAPFNSMASFELALTMNPDYIETDLQLSKDGVLVCIHDVSLEEATNIEEVFPDRSTEILRNGKKSKTWYVNDFTVAELKTLDFGSWFDSKFERERIATFQELLNLASGKSGVYPETKDPDFYRARGLDIDKTLHELLIANGLHTRDGQEKTPIIIQSFHESSLRRLRELGGDNYTLIQLVWFGQWDDFMTDKGLDHVATYADGIGPFLSMILPPNDARIYAAHERGLQVHVWKAHEAFPANGFSDATKYMSYLLDVLKIDGLFTDQPDVFPKTE